MTGKGFASFFLFWKWPIFHQIITFVPIFQICLNSQIHMCLLFSPRIRYIWKLYSKQITSHNPLYIYIYIIHCWRKITPQRCMFGAPWCLIINSMFGSYIYIFNWNIQITPFGTDPGIWLISCVSSVNLYHWLLIGDFL